MTNVGVLQENAQISRRFWRKLISLRSSLAEYNTAHYIRDYTKMGRHGRPPDKSVYSEIIFLISQFKHNL